MELVFEIGCEEIPAWFIGPALEQLEELVRKQLDAERLGFESIKTFGTPRRLALVVAGLPEKQEDVVEERTGPSKKVAFDQDGNPTKAAIGFAKGAGIDVADIQVKETDKGEYIVAEVKKSGRATMDVLAEMLPSIISSINFRKSMRWGNQDVRFARPIHWLLAILDGKVIDFEFAELKSGSTTRGHRFTHPGEIEISSGEEYISKLKAANVIVDIEERQAEIKRGLEEAAKSLNAEIAAPKSLLEEVGNLVEHPTIVIGAFPEEFLEVPEAVIVTAMTEHQRYFPLKKDGKLIPNFITVSGSPVKDIKLVARGNERVLKARLSDAQFFYNEDKKTPLPELLDRLKDVVFQAKVGSYYEKVTRMSEVAGFIANQIDPGNETVKEAAEEAARLCKNDLVTHMVGEFPSLQGTIGGEYARLSGLPDNVAQAIGEHYLPKGAADIDAGNFPSSVEGCCVALADRFDTLVGCLRAGLAPTADQDPYALRRAALGAIGIVLKFGFHLSLSSILGETIKIYGSSLPYNIDKRIDQLGSNNVQIKLVIDAIKAFFQARLKVLFVGREKTSDIVEAVLRASFDDIVDAEEKIKALSALKETPEFEPLMISFKRVGNIIGDFDGKSIDEGLFQTDEERKLFGEFKVVEKKVEDFAENRQFAEALNEMKTLKPHVDAFFDAVLVMDKDEKLKNNRLSLLTNIRDMFLTIADFSVIVVEG